MNLFLKMKLTQFCFKIYREAMIATHKTKKLKNCANNSLEILL